jgi:site-specific recombinase XerD
MYFMEKLMTQYLEWKGTYAHRASINYRIWLRRFLEVCGNKPLETYNVSDLVKYRSWLENHYGSYSVQFAVVVIKNFFQFCITQGHKCMSPSLIRLPRVNAKSHRAITEKEYHKLTSRIPTNDFVSLRNSLIVHLLWDTGVRISELGDLDVTQIDEQKYSTVISTKKTGNKRIIIWSSETHNLLMKYLSVRMELPHQNRTTALFVGWNKGSGWSQRLTSRSMQRIIKECVHSAGIPEKITPHSFRHGWAHKRRDQNAPLAFIQKGLGHLNPVSTFIYQQYNDREFETSAKEYLKS